MGLESHGWVGWDEAIHGAEKQLDVCKAHSGAMALGPRADLDGGRATLVGAPEKTPLTSLDYELPQLQILYGGPGLICLHSCSLQAWRCWLSNH